LFKIKILVILGKERFQLSDIVINGALGFSEIFIKKSIKDLISGYDDTIMRLANVFLPSLVKDKKFSLLFGVITFY
jgi:hypothetical protein